MNYPAAEKLHYASLGLATLSADDALELVPLDEALERLESLEALNRELLAALELVAAHLPHWATQLDVKQIDRDVFGTVRAAIAKAQS